MRRSPALVHALVGLTAMALGDAAPAARIVVGNDAELRVAVQRLASTGGEILLRPGRYGAVVVGARSGPRLTLLARGASTRSLRLSGTRNVRVLGLRVGSSTGPASEVFVAGSGRVTLERIVVAGSGRSPARVHLDGSTDVMIRDSRFTRCGEKRACIMLGLSSRVRVVGNTFGHCLDCDGIRGRVGSGLVVRDNIFGNALRGRCPSGAACQHQDLIQLQRGRDILIERNRFGINDHGAAQVYLSGPLDRVTVRNNVFRGSHPSRPGYVAPVAITVGNRGEPQHPPHRVVIAHNTMLSGAAHRRGSRSSIALTHAYAYVPEALRPVVVNNVLALLELPVWVCRRARLIANNIVMRGQTCTSTDVLGDPLIGAVWGRPTSASLTIDRGAPGWAVDDIDRARRDAHPDVGAYEYIET